MKKPSVDFSHGHLKVSDNGRFLQHQDGTPFFFLGDTAWELFNRLTREEADRYLENRRQKGFTVIQAVNLSEFNGLNTPNAYGEKPLIDHDPTRPNEAYFQHIDYIVHKAMEKGLVIGMLPTWGDKVDLWKWGVGPVIFNVENARIYGNYLGKRYKASPNLIWILGGDRSPAGYEDIWRAMAYGLTEGDEGKHLKTYHPLGWQSSSLTFHDESWMDFNMLQSGHSSRDFDNYSMIKQDYDLVPIKPCMDAEPRYENHSVDWNPEKGYFNDYDVRQAAYWALFAGAFGHTYGCHEVWQMYIEGGREAVHFAHTTWYDAVDLPGAFDMQHIRNLIESRPYFIRIPDQSILLGDQGTGADHVQATRASDGSYAFVYIPTGNPISIDMGKISSSIVKAYWFNPREGTAEVIGLFLNTVTQLFTPPSSGRNNDWVLVLDDADKGFPIPGLTNRQEKS